MGSHVDSFKRPCTKPSLSGWSLTGVLTVSVLFSVTLATTVFYNFFTEIYFLCVLQETFAMVFKNKWTSDQAKRLEASCPRL